MNIEGNKMSNYKEVDPYIKRREMKRTVQNAMKDNGYRIKQRDIVPIESYTKHGYKFTYIMFVDKRTLDVYRMWFNKWNYTDDHPSFWEVVRVGTAALDLFTD